MADLITTKVCSKCKKEKPFSEFRSNKKGRYGIHAQCIPCHDLSSKESYKKNKSYRIELSKDWQVSHPTQSKEIKRNWAAKNREELKDNRNKSIENSTYN